MAMVGQTIYPFVLLVQCDSHAERLNVFGDMLEEEEKRLQAKVALQSLFNGADAKQTTISPRRRRAPPRGEANRGGRHERGAQCRPLASDARFCARFAAIGPSRTRQSVTRVVETKKNLRDVSTCQ